MYKKDFIQKFKKYLKIITINKLINKTLKTLVYIFIIN